MYKSTTTYILGAGASWHYGFPTGDKLITDAAEISLILSEYFRLESKSIKPDYPNIIIEKLSDIAKTSHNIHKSLTSTAEELKELHERIKLQNPTVIDYFLTMNPSVSDAGRFAIAFVIHKCHWAWQKYRHNQNIGGNGRDDWYRFIIHNMTLGMTKPEQLTSNQLYFITFNYDTTLENNLKSRLNSIDMLRGHPVVEEFIKSRIVHVYGKIAHPSPEPDFSAFHNTPIILAKAQIDPKIRGAITHCINAASFSAQHIRTISDQKSDGAEEIEMARHFIDIANNLYILGFGFDENNCNIIGLSEKLLNKQLRLTNFGASPKIQRSIERTFGLPYEHPSNGTLTFVDASAYDALANHFP